MSKYDPLARHLAGLDRSRSHTLTFERIAAILGSPLPGSATRYQAWWANQKDGRHVQANAWLDEGWITEDLSLGERRVTFVPANTPRLPQAAAKPGITLETAKRGVALHYGIRPDQVEISIRT